MKKPKYNFGTDYVARQLIIIYLRKLKKVSIFGPTRIIIKKVKRELNDR